MHTLTLRGALAGAIAIAAAVIAPATAASAAPPTAPYSAFVLDVRNLSDPMSSPPSRVMDHSNSQLTANIGIDSVGLSGFQDGGNWSVNLHAPSLSSGQTYQAGVGNVSMSVQGTMLSCTGNGSFTVHELVRDAETQFVSTFAVSFLLDCHNKADAISGELRWMSSVPYTGVATSGYSGYVSAPVGELTNPKTLTFTSGGSLDAVFGNAHLGGSTPGAFAIRDDQCSGKTLSFGQACTVTVWASPRVVGWQEAMLVVPSNTLNGSKVILMQVEGKPSYKGLYKPLDPARILDSRSGNGVAAHKLTDFETVPLQVLGRGGVPATGVSAVVLNVTVTEPDQAGHVTVYPGGEAKPTASALNYTRGWTGANSVTVKVGANGQVNFAVTGGKLHLIADVVGFYTASDYKPVFQGAAGRVFTHEPGRLFDSRVDDGGQKLVGGGWFRLSLSYPEVNPHVRALIVNVTVTEPNGSGHLRLWNGASGPPDTSTLNYESGKTVPNFAIVPTSPCIVSGCDPSLLMIGLYTNQTTHVIVDLVGFVDDGTLSGGLRFEASSPTRIVDTRISQGITGRIGQGQTATVTTPGALVQDNTWALALNVTGVQPTMDTNLIVWENGIAQPGVSNLNPAAGQIIPNAVITGIDENYKFNIRNNGGTIDVVVDVVGMFYADAVMDARALASPAAGKLFAVER
ncbi:hypothetical protein [Catelliglobosispora koreensis]|uniref:hypothetical protein n=1 Tax=Catelliglobosispora koreensis TaxID=129052 RepID=UPI0003A90687|nr:hypothetical protein [Catelliglobosispora koreensis]